MSTPPSSGVLVLLAVGVVVIVLAGCLVAMQRLSLERRARFARVLGHAFLVVVAAAMILGMVAQAFR
jgi:hypothetical protein